jgi:hypothetical protein
MLLKPSRCPRGSYAHAPSAEHEARPSHVGTSQVTQELGKLLGPDVVKQAWEQARLEYANPPSMPSGAAGA